MLNTLFILQYSFLNGYLLHRFFLKEKDSPLLEIFLSSLFLSWCLNSLAIYALVRLFDIPFTKPTVVIVSASLTFMIYILSIFFHSDRNHVLMMERRNPLARLWKGIPSRRAGSEWKKRNTKK